MHIAVIGTGYVGLVTGACFSEFGHNVVCVDRDAAKIKNLEAGKMPIYEPGLDEMVHQNKSAGRLRFTTDLGEAVKGASAIFIAVGTPTVAETGAVDLKYVHQVVKDITPHLRGYCIVVTKSTVPVGTTQQVYTAIKKARPELDFDVVSNPEFLREGSALDDFMKPDRIVVGTSSDRARNFMSDLYRPLLEVDTPVLFTAPESSELIKYASNALLAVKVGFINEVANLSERVGADIMDVAKGVGMDSRIGPKFLQPGPGYGGSCFPKDTLALAHTAREEASPLSLVEAVIQSNDNRKRDMADKIVAACDGNVKGKIIAVLGLTFKPNTDDMRDSPSLEIIPALQKAGASIRAFDPKGMAHAAELLPGVEMGKDAYSIMNGADALVVLTEWNEFRVLDLPQVYQILKSPLIVDLRNIYKAEEMEYHGFTYVSVGRPMVESNPKVKRLIKKHAV